MVTPVVSKSAANMGAKAENNVWSRVGFDPVARLRWLVRFGNLEFRSLTKQQRALVCEEARAFVTVQQLDPAIREVTRNLPAPTDAVTNILSIDEIRRVQRWLNRGLRRLGRHARWHFTPRVKYELDAYKGWLVARSTADSPVARFKALAFEVFRDGRLGFRICSNCQQSFVPIGRQVYCSPQCSQAVRTRKWRKAHPEKNRAIRQAQYRKRATQKSRDARPSPQRPPKK